MVVPCISKKDQLEGVKIKIILTERKKTGYFET